MAVDASHSPPATSPGATLLRFPRSAPLPAVAVGDIPIFDGTREEATAACLEAIWSRRGGRVATVNLDFLAIARQDSRLREDLLNSTLIVADGSPVVSLARIAGASRVERTPGVDLVADLCREGGLDGELRVVLYGGAPEVAERARRVIEAMSPGVQVPLVLTPPYTLTADQIDEERDQIRQADPHLVLVALGCPRQEARIRDYYDSAPQALWIGVGGTLDFLAGHRRRAAPWIQRFGLEWFARFVQEPARLGPRYFRRDLPVLPGLTVAALATRRRRRTDSSRSFNHEQSTLSQEGSQNLMRRTPHVSSESPIAVSTAMSTEQPAGSVTTRAERVSHE